MSVRCITGSDGSPSYFRVNAMTIMRYSVYGPADGKYDGNWTETLSLVSFLDGSSFHGEVKWLRYVAKSQTSKEQKKTNSLKLINVYWKGCPTEASFFSIGK